ncbi:hypothetical protein GQ53DRAFT_717109 [Thozetella sp. PMI_491]|nr:hypothetical protein GQ53DRAFT_717109 [Thozetella sp. PMI_491]
MSTSRKYGLSCLVCRRRKVRCDGKKPTCDACKRCRETCSYAAPDASLSRLSNALGRSEARVAELQEALRASARDRQNSIDHTVALAPETEGTTPSLSVDENGSVQYYGATSRFHVAPSQTQETQEAASKATANEAYHRKWLLSNARFQKSWDRAIYANLRSSTELDADSASTLLQIYWTWQAPLHNCVYRRCFTRDMVLGGPYFSPFLLNVIYAHACRHTRQDDPRFAMFDRGEFFLQKAKLLLLKEIELERPQIPTIQGLLILGGRQCALGKNSQGWLYTGMAIRMLQHLGFHLPKAGVELLEKLEPDDLEVRKRLYISAYAWDKSISLTLGRPPTLTDIPYSPLSLFDNSDDLEDWFPFYLEKDPETHYPPTPSYNTTTFSHFGEQSKLIHEMYNTIYNRRVVNLDTETVSALEKKFRSFHQGLPSYIRVDDIDSLPSCPPPHVFSLNILYHTSLILLYRPFFRIPSVISTGAPEDALFHLAYKVCTEEAIKVNAFFRAYGRTFWFRNQTYLTSYCVYTAATIEVQQVRHPDPQVSAAAIERLATTLKMMEVECSQTPGIRRSRDIIKAQLDAQTASDLDHEQQLAVPEDTRAREAHGLRPMTITELLEGGAAGGLVTNLSSDLSRDAHIGAPDIRSSQGAIPSTSTLEPGLITPATELDGGVNILPSSWLDWYISDASGGFIQEANMYGIEHL